MQNENVETKEVHISTIVAGDTIIHNGHLTTVNANYIKKGGFCGTTLFGDSYRSGTRPVTKVVKWVKK